MKLHSLAALLVLITSSSGFSTDTFADEPSKCESAAKKMALETANRKLSGDSAETRAVTGSKTLKSLDHLEVILVGISDEVDPSDWIVIVDKKCKKKFVGMGTDGSPEFKFPGLEGIVL